MMIAKGRDTSSGLSAESEANHKASIILKTHTL
jgi:hypothetical protein